MQTLHLSGVGGDGLTITSSDEQPEPYYWRVTLHNDGLTASTDVDLDGIRHTVAPIGDFFAALAADWRGWAGEHTWGGTEITLTATHDGRLSTSSRRSATTFENGRGHRKNSATFSISTE